jgi:hypothetical protein
MHSLNDDDLALLDFEAGFWKYSGAKAEAIRRQFGLTATGYYQRLLVLARRPEALAARPQVVNRINRRRRQPVWS